MDFPANQLISMRLPAGFWKTAMVHGVTLLASAWSGNAQTITVPGVLADETKQLIQPVPAIASQAAYLAAGILCTGQAANNLTFTCQTVPEADLTVYVVITDVKS